MMVRIVIAAFILMLPQIAAAQGIDSKTANAYYANCLAQDHPVFGTQTQKMFCACTAAQMQQKIQLAEMKMVYEDSAEGLWARNKVLREVYAPCIEYPARDLVYNQCENNPQIAAATTNAKPICTCLSDNVAIFIKSNAQNVIAESLRANPNTLDPLGALMNSQSFQANSQQVMLGCIKKHGF